MTESIEQNIKRLEGLLAAVERASTVDDLKVVLTGLLKEHLEEQRRALESYYFIATGEVSAG